MTVNDQISRYLESLPEIKQGDMRKLHGTILEMNPGSRLWFFDGKDETGKVVSNPSIGYGAFTKNYADGTTKEFYQVGISANSSGLSVYLMGLDDKKYLQENYADALGKASITGYCIKFRTLGNIDVDILKAAIRDGFEQARA